MWDLPRPGIEPVSPALAGGSLLTEAQLEKNHVVPTAWQDEALARDGVSREVPCSALKGETAALLWSRDAGLLEPPERPQGPRTDLL